MCIKYHILHSWRVVYSILIYIINIIILKIIYNIIYIKLILYIKYIIIIKKIIIIIYIYIYMHWPDLLLWNPCSLICPAWQLSCKDVCMHVWKCTFYDMVNLDCIGFGMVVLCPAIRFPFCLWTSQICIAWKMIQSTCADDHILYVLYMCIYIYMTKCNEFMKSSPNDLAFWETTINHVSCVFFCCLGPSTPVLPTPLSTQCLRGHSGSLRGSSLWRCAYAGPTPA